MCPLARIFVTNEDGQTIEEQIDQYDREERQGRTDFLQQLRRKDDPDRANHKRDLMNHLSNNVYVAHFGFTLFQSAGLTKPRLQFGRE